MTDLQTRGTSSRLAERDTRIADLRLRVRRRTLAPEDALVRGLIAQASLTQADHLAIETEAIAHVRHLREDAEPGLMEVMLAEYGLSTDEGLALMCLAEALLRVPDAETVDALIEDKIAPGAWMAHFGHSSSALVNASTLGLALTGRVLTREGLGRLVSGAVRRVGEPVIRAAVGRAMRKMGRQFVLGQTIEEAARRAKALEAKGFTHSYDMLGEAAMTAADATRFEASYAHAIATLAAGGPARAPRDNPGISIKLSALHPRYETAQRERVMDELVPRVLDLAHAAAEGRMGLNIDAEEMARLDLSLDVIAAVLSDESLAGWDGFGVVVQAYGKRAGAVIDWLHALATRLDRRIMVRLVKGAYWDAEIKRAQVEGLAGFPVFTRKAATDVSYIAVAGRLLGLTDRIYPQFATHNAHTVAAILHMAERGGIDPRTFEFQRLHGMGEALHAHLARTKDTRCRIYAPVGRHEELLAYLVRRLLENGANSSFVNQVLDKDVPARDVVANPFAAALEPARAVVSPPDLFAPRRNSRGFDLADPTTLDAVEEARAPFRHAAWEAAPLIAATGIETDATLEPVTNPADPSAPVGTVRGASPDEIAAAIAVAAPWGAPASVRAGALRRAADLLEVRWPEIFALLAREAGKTLADAVAELREAVDFLRYYADEAERLSRTHGARAPLGTVACISPWNFPLAIFTGQIAGALAAGNAVLAKPSEETPLIGHLGCTLLHEAGVPRTALQLLPGNGAVGAALTRAPLQGIVFTGSTATARAIHRAMAEHMAPGAPLIAETGGLNAMIVDSTALPEQAVRDIVASAFQSAGQRCSAARIVYVQDDVADDLIAMLTGALDALRLGDPWHLATDIGPVITPAARDAFAAYVAKADGEDRVLHRIAALGTGSFFAPTLLRVSGIASLEREVFGPVLHLATYPAGDLDTVIDAINARGYGLTFGLHTRITARAGRVTARVRAGNRYVNHNQIGAVVGSQPFGGEGLSGTGPKAGGPHYVARLTRPHAALEDGRAGAPASGASLSVARVQAALDALPAPATDRLVQTVLPGPTGENNVLSRHPRGAVLCLGPSASEADAQAAIARAAGCPALKLAPGAKGVERAEGVEESALDGRLDPTALEHLTGFAVAASYSGPGTARAMRRAMRRALAAATAPSSGSPRARTCSPKPFAWSATPAPTPRRPAAMPTCSRGRRAFEPASANVGEGMNRYIMASQFKGLWSQLGFVSP